MDNVDTDKLKNHKMYLVFVAVVALLGGVQSITQCTDNPSAVLTVTKLTEPVILKQGSRFEADFSIHIKEQFPTEFKAEISLQKKVWFAWVPLPCIKEVGSCTYHVTCDMLNKLQIENGGVVNHKCPAAAGETVTQKVGLTLPAIPGPVSAIGSGTYWARAKLVGPNGKVLACVEKYIEVKS